MKHIKLFESFLNESLSKNKKLTKAEEAKLRSAAIEGMRFKDSDDFIDEFVECFGSACDIWMSEADKNKLMELYANDAEVMCLSGESEDGSNDSAYAKAERDGWTLLADEQNYENYDSVFYKEVKPKKIKK
jgi:hypothetical protein